MSKREQTLLGLLLLTLVGVGVVFVYQSIYLPRYQAAQLKLTNAQQQVQTAKAVSETQELIHDEQTWLTTHEPEPISQQSAQSSLQKLCESMAVRNQLEIKSQTLLPAIATEGRIYHRSRMDLTISGKEQNFYNWISALDNPELFQRVTFLRLYPSKSDDTLIEAKVVIDKWYLPSES